MTQKAETGTPLHRLEREAASAGADAVSVNVLAGDYTDCGGRVPAETRPGQMVGVPVKALSAVINAALGITPEPEPAVVAPEPEPEPKPAAKSRGKSNR